MEPGGEIGFLALYNTNRYIAGNTTQECPVFDRRWFHIAVPQDYNLTNAATVSNVLDKLEDGGGGGDQGGVGGRDDGSEGRIGNNLSGI